jgi:hypothetical protein
MGIRLLLILLVNSLIASSIAISAVPQVRGEESAQGLFVSLQRDEHWDISTLHLDVLVDPDKIDRKHLEEIFKVLTKDTGRYRTIYIDVWDDRHAWATGGNDFTAKFLTPDEDRLAGYHHRATYGKRNTPPVIESYSFHPSLGSPSVKIDLVSGKEETPSKEEPAKIGGKSNIVIAGTIYRQVPEILYLSINDGWISDEVMVRTTCNMIEKNPSLSRIHYFDNEVAAKSAHGLYNPSLGMQSHEKDESISSHSIGTYVRSVGFLFNNSKKDSPIDINEDVCKSDRK